MNSILWTVTTVIALFAAGSGIVAWKSLFKEPFEAANRRKLIEPEITFRLEDINNLLRESPLTKGTFYRACNRFSANGIGVSEKYKNEKLKTLMFEFAKVVPKNKIRIVKKLQSQLQDLSELAPEAPFKDKETPDPEKVAAAQRKVQEIKSTWNDFRQEG